MSDRVSLLVCLFLLLGACTGGSGPEAAPPARVAATDTPAVPLSMPGPECANAGEVFDSEQGAAQRETFRGDVDGDGVDDVVSLAVDEEAMVDCQVFLAVHTDGVLQVLPVTQEGMTVEPTLGVPRLATLAQIDGRPGADIVIDLVAGASSRFAAVFTVGSGTLERLTLSAGGPYGDLFPYGGSVGHVESSDCSGAGGVVISEARPAGDRYRVRKTRFVLRDEASAMLEEASVVTDVIAASDLGDVVASVPFDSCPSS